MKNDRIEFYEEVKIKNDSLNHKYRGKLGAILGIGEDEDGVHSYAVALHGLNIVVSFEKNDVIPTGKKFSREDFY